MDQKSPSYKGLDGHDGLVSSPVTKYVATHPTTTAFASLFFSWILIILSIPVALDKVIADIFSLPCTSPDAAAAGYPGCLGANHVIAVLVFIVFSLVSFLCIGYSLIIFTRARSPVKWVGVGLCLVTLFAPAVGVMAVYVRPAEVYTPVDALQRILGVYYFAASFALLFSTAFVLFRMIARRHASDSFFPGSSTPILGSHRGDGNVLDQSVDIKFTDHVGYGVSPLVTLSKSFALLLFFGGVFVMTGFFPAVWAGPVGSYITAWSPYAYNIDLGPLIVWKSYPDIVAYYAFIAGIIWIGIAAQYLPGFRRFLHRRGIIFFGRFCRSSPLAPHMTFGEQLLLVKVAGLAAFWLWYFRWGFDYIQLAVAGSGDPNPLITIWARVFGHFTNLSMSFLAYPVTRNSFWESVFGVPYERAIKYHRGLGSLTYILVSIHMLLWYIKFGNEGHLLQNLFTTTGLTISDANVHFDNFTVALCQFGWIGLTIMVILTWFRRMNWEAFRVSHYFAVVFLVIALLHAWSNWYYTTGGLLLWLYDRAARSYSRATTSAELISAEHAYGVTRLVFQNPSFKAQPGQYVYLHFPEISIFEWHPFSVSSCNGSLITFHIKSMGPGTFTDKLAHHVSSFPIYKQNVALGSPSGISRTQFDVTSDDGDVNVNGPGRNLTAYLDGPYGRFADLTGRSELLLIAGGIGATPLMALLGDLHQRFMAAHQGVPLPRALQNLRLIRLVFCASDVHTIYAFAPLLSSIKANNQGNNFDIRLFSTQRSDHGQDGPSSFTDVTSDAIQAISASIHHGRPDLNAICSEFMVASKPDALVAVCGPTGMIEAADKAAYLCGLDFHSETFEL